MIASQEGSSIELETFISFPKLDNHVLNEDQKTLHHKSVRKDESHTKISYDYLCLAPVGLTGFYLPVMM